MQDVIGGISSSIGALPHIARSALPQERPGIAAGVAAPERGALHEELVLAAAGGLVANPNVR